jgi:hypothetical protein
MITAKQDKAAEVSNIFTNIEKKLKIVSSQLSGPGGAV